MDSYLVIGSCSLSIGLWNLIIAILGLFPQCRSTVIGTLHNAKTKKNVKGRSGFAPIPIRTEYTYTYTVKGKTYQYLGKELSTKRHLLPKVSMVYVKGFPRHAYPNKFKGTNEWTIAFIMFLIGVPTTLVAILN